MKTPAKWKGRKEESSGGTTKSTDRIITDLFELNVPQSFCLTLISYIYVCMYMLSKEV